jgi:hypothetical protein
VVLHTRLLPQELGGARQCFFRMALQDCQRYPETGLKPSG